MENLIAIKLKYTWNPSKVTLYKLNRVLTKGVSPLTGEIFDVTKEMISERIKPEYQEGILDNGYDVIAISDADNFAERLVFAAFRNIAKDGTSPYGRSSVAIGGSNTMSIHGGDLSTLRDHKVYIRRLAILHGYQFEGIIDE